MLIETILAAFEMDEILYELREHAAGLNAGRWDYLFSCIKKFRGEQAQVLPDRAQLTMTQPFMRAYTQRLVETCHRRGAHAIGGMAAFIPSRRDPEVNATAMAKVRDDKERESGDGFDGTWVAHPGPRPARDRDLRRRPRRPAEPEGPPPGRLQRQRRRAARLHRRGRDRDRGRAAAERQRRPPVPRRLAGRQRRRGDQQPHGGRRDRRDLESQLWQWRNTATRIEDGRSVTGGLYTAIRDETLAALGGPDGGNGHLPEAAELLDGLVLDDEFPEFLTLGVLPARVSGAPPAVILAA